MDIVHPWQQQCDPVERSPGLESDKAGLESMTKGLLDGSNNNHFMVSMSLCNPFPLSRDITYNVLLTSRIWQM